jgi:hypothetical protein
MAPSCGCSTFAGMSAELENFDDVLSEGWADPATGSAAAGSPEPAEDVCPSCALGCCDIDLASDEHEPKAPPVKDRRWLAEIGRLQEQFGVSPGWARALTALPDREAFLLEECELKGSDLESAAEVVGTTPERAREIIDNAWHRLATLRDYVAPPSRRPSAQRSAPRPVRQRRPRGHRGRRTRAASRGSPERPRPASEPDLASARRPS